MKVMIAVDGSAGAFEAVDQIGRLLSPDADHVALFCSPPQVRVTRYQPDPAVLARAQEGVAKAIFEESRKRLPATMQASTETITGMQDARHSIAQSAEAWAQICWASALAVWGRSSDCSWAACHAPRYTIPPCPRMSHAAGRRTPALP